MKKITQKLKTIISIFLLIIATTTLSAQSGWENILEDSEAFFTDIYFVAGSDGLWETGWVTDYYGDIYKTEDGGDTWEVYTQSFSVRLSNLSFVDELIGYICTYDGKILKSTDGGVNWSEQLSNPSDWYSSITFKDALNGIVSGTPNMYTNDGGTTWTLASGGDSDEGYGYAAYASGNTYYSTEMGLFDYGAIGRSEDNGQSWNNIETGLVFLPNYIDCYGADHIMTGGASETVYFSHDGGSTWIEAEADDGSGDVLCFAWFDADTVWAAGSDIHKSTDGGYTWTVDTVIGAGAHKEIFVTQSNVVYVANDHITGYNTVWRKIGLPPFTADFDASVTTTCSGSTIDFTDLSIGPITAWSWTFEGGTPSTSSDQNPTVTYSTTGVYNVELTVTSTYGNDTKIKDDYIEILETPGQANTPVGETELCSAIDYLYSTDEVLYTQDYEWEITPSSAGDFVVSANEATLEIADGFSGDFSIQVRATNLCGNGDWSTAIEGSISESPEEFELEGGGSFCEGGDGVEITLSGSQMDIVYELFLNDVSTGITINGTGSEISFGMITDEGYYEAVGFNNNCERLMSEQIQVVVDAQPEPEITGEEMVCDFSTESYEVANNEGSVYTWIVTGGAIAEGQGTNLISIDWNGEGFGTITVDEETVDGCSGSSEQFDLLIDDCTGINDKSEENSLIIYPNPAKDFINISFKSNSTSSIITVYDITGQVAIEKQFQTNNGAQKLNVSNLINGMYLIKVQSGGKILTSKLFMKN